MSKTMKSLAAIAALTASLTFGAGAANADPGDGVSSGGVNYSYYPLPYYGPTCYGENASRPVWNLAQPGQQLYRLDSCRAAALVATKNVAGNYSLYVTLLTTRYPGLWPVAAMTIAWQTQNTILSWCASRGTGIQFLQSGNGSMVTCSPQ